MKKILTYFLLIGVLIFSSCAKHDLEEPVKRPTFENSHLVKKKDDHGCDHDAILTTGGITPCAKDGGDDDDDDPIVMLTCVNDAGNVLPNSFVVIIGGTDTLSGFTDSTGQCSFVLKAKRWTLAMTHPIYGCAYEDINLLDPIVRLVDTLRPINCNP